MNKMRHQRLLFDKPVCHIEDIDEQSYNFKNQCDVFDNIDLFWKEVDYSYLFNSKFNYKRNLGDSRVLYFCNSLKK